MSLTLDRNTKPKGPLVRVRERENSKEIVVLIDDFEIDLKDFLSAAHHVLTIVHLQENDPRLQFVACVRLMQVTEDSTVFEEVVEVGLEKIKRTLSRPKFLTSFIPPVLG